MDAGGNLFIGDYTSNVIRKVDPQGNITTLIEGTVYTPEQMSLDTMGNLFVADRGNHRVLRVVAVGLATQPQLTLEVSKQ